MGKLTMLILHSSFYKKTGSINVVKGISLIRYRQIILLMILLASMIGIKAYCAVIQGDANRGKLKIETCVACHGENGAGIMPSYPNIGGQGEAYLFKQMVDIRDGARNVPEMKAMVEKLTDQDIADIAAWYAKQVPVRGLAQNQALKMGWRLFHGGNLQKSINACAGCHSPTGRGIESAVFPALAGQTPQYIIKQLTDFREGNRANDMNGMMRSVAEKLSNKEIEALANYISGLY